MNSFKKFIDKVSFLITKKDKKDIIVVLFLGFIVGLFELSGLVFIVLMIQIFTDFTIIQNNYVLNYIYAVITLSKMIYFLIFTSIFILLFYFIKTVLSIIQAKKIAQLASNLYVGISKSLFRNYLNYYYKDISNKNTSDFNQILVVETDHLSLMLTSVINLIIHLTIVFLLYMYMIYIDFFLTLGLSFLIIIFIFSYKSLMSNKLVLMGEDRMLALTDYMKLIKISFSNYKVIKSLDNDFVEDKLQRSAAKYKKARVDMLFWAEVPRLVIEFLIVFILIGILVFLKLKYNDVTDLLLVVGSYALILFRMLPSLSRIVNGVNSFNMYKKTLDLVHLEKSMKIENKIDDNQTINFNYKIELKNISFKYYENDNNILSDVNLVIKKGEKIAIVGDSGSGKTTLLDILIGLHFPTDGNFNVDNSCLNSINIWKWRQSVSFVPQKVVLFESNVRENVTFGKDYNEKLFNKVLKDCFIYDTVMNKGGIDTIVGDEGVGFSGGQMQRLAFARALYQEKDILFLDEATSSLDEEIENKIIDNLLSAHKDKTIIAIVHKAKIADKFDRIIKVEDLTNG